MASSSRERKRGLPVNLDCPVCFDSLKDAKNLMCGHTFCKRCATNIVKKASCLGLNSHNTPAGYGVQCPCCRKRTILHGRSVDELSSNYAINSVVEELTKLAQVPRSKYDRCEQHEDNEMKYYCDRCKMAICSECGIEDHFSHNGARPKTLTEVADTFKKSIDEMLNVSRIKLVELTANVTSLQQMREDGLNTLERLKLAMRNAFEEKQRALEKERDDLFASIEEQREVFCHRVDGMVESNQHVIDQLGATKDNVQKCVETPRVAELVNSYEGWTRSLKAAHKPDPPAMDQVKADLEKVKRLTFVKYSAREKVSLGEIVEDFDAEPDRKRKRFVTVGVEMLAGTSGSSTEN